MCLTMYPGYAVTQKRDNVSNHLSFVPTSTVRNHDHVDLGVNGKKEFSNFEIQMSSACTIDRPYNRKRIPCSF